MKSEEIIIESIKNKKLRESVHRDLRERMRQLERSFNKYIEPGCECIPIPVFIMGDHMDTFNKNYRKHTGEFCTLVKVKEGTFDFVTKSGEIVEWPNGKTVGVSYMTTILAKDVSDYDTIRTMLSLIFNLNIPPTAEKE
jgi:hypothetical protein